MEKKLARVINEDGPTRVAVLFASIGGVEATVCRRDVVVSQHTVTGCEVIGFE